MNDYKLEIKQWREKKYPGKRIDLVPLSADLLQFVVDMRNQNKSAYFMNQEHRLSLAMQTEWFNKYLKTDNDMYWVYFDKTGIPAGTIRLYDIDGMKCEIGSSTADSSMPNSFFMFIDAHSLAMDFALNVLGVIKITSIVKTDNATVNAITKRLGFTVTGERIVRGESYYCFEYLKKS